MLAWMRSTRGCSTRLALIARTSGELSTRVSVSAKRASSRVERIQASIFDWQPPGQYDVVYFSFWLSHVPLERFEAFWSMVQGCLAPGGRVFFIDSLYDERSAARDHQLHGSAVTVVNRLLNDGRAYRIVKIFYRPADLEQRIEQLGWHAQVRSTPTYFLYGSAER